MRDPGAFFVISFAVSGRGVMEEDAVPELLARLRQGDAELEAEVVRRFAGRLLALTRHRLRKELAAKIGAEDVVQMAFGIFFAAVRAGRFTFADWHQLWSLLRVMVLRQCRQCHLYYRAGRRDIRREMSLSNWSETATEALRDHGGSAPETVAIKELLTHVRRQLKRSHRCIVTLRCQGHTLDQISARTGFSRRTVQRVLEHVRRCLRDVLE